MSAETFTVEDQRSKGFYQIDNELVTVYAPKIKANGIAVYNALVYHANNKKPGVVQECWPSHNTLAKESGMCRTAVIKALEKLEEHGLIKIISGRYDEVAKANEPNKYILLSLKETSKGICGGSTLNTQPPSTLNTQGVVRETTNPSTLNTHELYPVNYTHINNTHERDNAQAPEKIVSISKVHTPLDSDIEQLKGKWIKTLDLNCPTDKWFATHSALYGKKAMLAAIYEAGNRNEPIRDKRYVLAIAKNFTPARLEAYTDDGYPKPKPAATARLDGRSTFATGGNRTATTSKSEFERLRALPVEQQPNGGRWFANT